MYAESSRRRMVSPEVSWYTGVLMGVMRWDQSSAEAVKDALETVVLVA